MSGWPTLHVAVADQHALNTTLAELIGVLGPLPQADVIEPFAEGDGEPWELRVALPGLSPEGWAAIATVLPTDSTLSASTSAAVYTADDLGLRLVDYLSAGGIEARQHSAGDGGAIWPELARAATADDAITELELDLGRALQAVGPAVHMRSDRGEDTVTPVIRRSDGRLGVEIVIGGLGTDLDQRERALAAVASVIEARVSHDLALAPDVLWDCPLGSLRFLVWLVAPPAAPLQGALEVNGPLTGRPDLPFDTCEIQVVPAADHAATIAAVAPVAEAHGWTGADPRWLTHNGRPTFCPVWRSTEPCDARDIDMLPEVAAVRVVPAEPTGLAGSWPAIEPHWWDVDGRFFVRFRDRIYDRDCLEVLTAERPIAERFGDHHVSAVLDTAHTSGLRIRLPLSVALVPTLTELLDTFPGTFRGTIAWGSRDLVVHLWMGPVSPEGSVHWRRR